MKINIPTEIEKMKIKDDLTPLYKRDTFHMTSEEILVHERLIEAHEQKLFNHILIGKMIINFDCIIYWDILYVNSIGKIIKSITWIKPCKSGEDWEYDRGSWKITLDDESTFFMTSYADLIIEVENSDNNLFIQNSKNDIFQKIKQHYITRLEMFLNDYSDDISDFYTIKPTVDGLTVEINLKKKFNYDNSVKIDTKELE